MFKLSATSRANLGGVHPQLCKVVERAIELTPVDFKVGEGLRTAARQQKLVASGASQTMRSKHLKQPDGYSHAVDLHALIDGSVAWDWPLYYKIAAAMQKAAIELGINIRWGGCWSNLRECGNVEKAVQGYVAMKKKQGKSAFMDGPHFELC